MKITIHEDNVTLKSELSNEHNYLKVVIDRILFVYPDTKITTSVNGLKITGVKEDLSK